MRRPALACPIMRNALSGSGLRIYEAQMSYDQFWLTYLRAHARPATRLLHYCGSLLALICLALAALRLQWGWLLAAPLVGYGFAWGAHLGIEGNTPKTFGHPFWSLASDYRMLVLWLTGGLGAQLRRSGLQDGGR